MNISQFIELMRNILKKEPDLSAFMAETYAANRRFETDDFNFMVNYTSDYGDDCEIFTITDMDSSTMRGPIKIGDNICTIKKSEDLFGIWLYQTGNAFDICNVDEELDSSTMLQDVAAQYGDAKCDKIIKLADYLLYLLNTYY